MNQTQHAKISKRIHTLSSKKLKTQTTNNKGLNYLKGTLLNSGESNTLLVRSKKMVKSAKLPETDWLISIQKFLK